MIQTPSCPGCGRDRPARGSCKTCRTRFCSTCRTPLCEGNKDRRCPGCNRNHARSWGSSHPEVGRERSKAWRLENPAKVKENHRRWDRENPDQARNRVSMWQAANPVRVRASRRKWSKSNLESVREKNRRRRATMKGCVVSATDIQKVIERSAGLCALCRTFVPEGLRHIDHIIPLDKGGPHSQENLQLTCYRCNASKGAKMPDEVEPERWVKQDNPDQPFLINPNWR
jgi:5-methylcytosine-specific restriction endonuclease McrA